MTGIICPLLKIIKLQKHIENDSFVIINLKWIDDFHILALTSSETLHLIELVKGTILDSQKITDIDLVYNTADFKVCFLKKILF